MVPRSVIIIMSKSIYFQTVKRDEFVLGRMTDEEVKGIINKQRSILCTYGRRNVFH